MLFCQIEMSQKHDKLMQYEIIRKKQQLMYVWMDGCMYISCMYILFTIKLLSRIHLHLPPFLAKKLLENQIIESAEEICNHF